MEQYYNIALYPKDEQLVSTCIELARKNLREQADQYLLGDDAWPHVTLCQFVADDGRIDEIWSQVKDLAVPAIRFSLIYLMPGTKLHAGRYWVGLLVRQTKELIELQGAVFDAVTALSIDGFTKPETYQPHLTLARCLSDQSLAISHYPREDLWRTEHQFQISLGRSDENGVYHEQLRAAD